MSTSLPSAQELNQAVLSQTTARTFAPASPWLTLLWKDWRQLQAATLAIMAGMLTAQLAILVGGTLFLSQSSWQGMTEGLATLAMISPALVAIAAGGMLIGHERQTGTWNWSSSLPVHWSLALASKLTVSFLAILSTLALLSVVPILSAVFFAALPNNSWVFGYYGSAFSLLLAIDTVVFFLLAALIFRDALNALLVGAAWVLGIQVLLVAIPLQLLAYYGRPADRVPEWLLATEMAVVLLGGIVGLVAAFRWRWGNGQNATLSLLPRRLTSQANASYIASRVGDPPGEWPMLFRLGLQNSLGKRLAILGLLGLGLLMGVAYDPAPFVACAVAVCGLFGVTAFEGDQTNHRYGFLADRGVSPRRLTNSRLLVPVFFAAMLAVIGLVWFAWLQENLWQAPWVVPAVVGVLLSAVLCGSLASLSFDKTAISAVIALVTCIVAGMIYGMAMSIMHWLDPNPYWFATYSFSLFLLFSIPTLVWAIYRRVPVWLIDARPKLAGKYFGLVGLLLIGPALLAANFGFLLLPKVPWQGLPPEKFQRQVSVPLFQGDIDLLPNVTISPPPPGAYPGYVSEYYVELRDKLLVDGELPWDFVANSEKALGNLKQAVDSQLGNRDARYTASWLNDLLLATAAVTLLHAEAGEQELARQSLELHGQLRKLSAEQMAPDTVENRVYSAQMLLDGWDSLQLGQLGTTAELKSWLLPDISDNADQYRELVRARASYDLAVTQGKNLSETPQGWPIRYSRGSPVFYPPMRWRVERSIAGQLADALAYIDEGRLTNYSSAYSYNLYLHEYSIRNQLQVIRAKFEAIVDAAADSEGQETEQDTPKAELE